MKAEDFLKEKVVYLSTSLYSEDKKGGLQPIADVRGWGAIQNLFKDSRGRVDLQRAGAFQDELGEWIADAINQKLNKEG